MKKELRWKTKYESQSKCPEYDCEEAPEQYTQDEKVNFR